MAFFGKTIAFILMMTTALSFADSPDWALKGNYAFKIAKVSNVSKEESADLITIDTGSQSNFRIGAICLIKRVNEDIAKMAIVESNKQRSVGIVIEGSQVQQGDAVYIIPAN